MSTNATMLLFRRLLGQIIHDGRLTVIAPNGGVHHIGNGTPSITIRIVDPAVIPRLLLNPDLALGEAYMDGALLVDDGDIYGFLDLCFSNIGWSTGQGVRRARAALSRLVRRFVQHDPLIPAIYRKNKRYSHADRLQGGGVWERFCVLLRDDHAHSLASIVSRFDTRHVTIFF